MSVLEAKKELWESTLREGFGRFSLHIKTGLYALVEDDEWPVFEELVSELLDEYMEGMRNWIIP